MSCLALSPPSASLIIPLNISHGRCFCSLHQTGTMSSSSISLLPMPIYYNITFPSTPSQLSGMQSQLSKNSKVHGKPNSSHWSFYSIKMQFTRDSWRSANTTPSSMRNWSTFLPLFYIHITNLTTSRWHGVVPRRRGRSWKLEMHSWKIGMMKHWRSSKQWCKIIGKNLTSSLHPHLLCSMALDWMTMKHSKVSLTIIITISFNSWHHWTLMAVLLNFIVISVTSLWMSWKIWISLDGGQCIVSFIHSCCSANYTIETQEFISYSCPDCQGHLHNSSLIGTLWTTVLCRHRNHNGSSFTPWCRQIWTSSEYKELAERDQELAEYDQIEEQVTA